MSKIDGPIGLFSIPESENPRTRESCEVLTRQVWDGCYDHPDLPLWPAQRILDIGAGWGAFSAWALSKWPVARITAYEPNAKAVPYYRENLALAMHVAGTVQLIEAAVTINPSPTLNGCEDWGSYHVALADDTCAWSVRGVHPRELPRADIVKCDVEGLEIEVLEHYRYLTDCKALLVEWHSPEKAEQVREICEFAGFRCLRNEGGTYGVSIWRK